MTCIVCGAEADHYLLPQRWPLCITHYRQHRPYTLDEAAYDTFKEMLTDDERAKWEAILAEQRLLPA